MPFSEPMEVTPSVPETQPDATPTPVAAAPASQPPARVPPPPPLAAASRSQGVLKEKAAPASTSGVVRVAKDHKHLEQTLGSVDLEETLSPGQCVCASVCVSGVPFLRDFADFREK